MKMKTFLFVCGIFVFLSCQAKESIRIYAYPASIYDDARCSVYQDFQTDLTFTFHYVGVKNYGSEVRRNKVLCGTA